MLRQYSPQRSRAVYLRNKSYRVGTIDIGETFHWNGRLCMVAGWFPREIGAAAKVDGRYVSRKVAHGGHLALVQDVRSRRTFPLADHHIMRALEA
jgi:hypothetical protein